MNNKKVISRKNLQWIDSNIAGNKVTLKFKKRSKLGKLFGSNVTKEIKIPEGKRVKSIENNKPSVGKITLFFKNK